MLAIKTAQENTSVIIVRVFISYDIVILLVAEKK